MRLGLFGGTFNPIHLGHLRAAVEVREAFDLEKILLVPAALPPHKDIAGIASAKDRFRMLQMATEGVPFLEVSDVELVRTGHSYTVDTLKDYRDRCGPSGNIFFVVGIDAFAEITTWKSYRDLFSLANFVVMERPGARVKNLGRFIHKHISDAYEEDDSTHSFHHPTWYAIHRLAISHLDISSTFIRARIRRGKSVCFLVPPQVNTFMEEKGLYR